MNTPVLLCAGTLASLCLSPGSPAQPAPGFGERTSVDLTIYNQNLSLVREERTFALGRGTTTVVVPDVPATIDGTSVHFVSLTDPEGVRVLEQNYQYDLVHQAHLGDGLVAVDLRELLPDGGRQRGRIA